MLGLGASAASAVIVHLANGSTVSYLPAPGSTPVSSGGSPSGSTVRPFDAFFKNLDYNGGPVMTSNTNYTFYWRPKTAVAYPTGFTSGVNTYFKDLEHDSGGSQNVDSVASQYNDAAGGFAEYNSKFGGELVDEHAYPASGCTRAPICLTDEQIQTELKKYIGEHALPTGLGVEYFVLTPEGLESCFEPGAAFACSANVTSPEFQKFCAYHGNIPPEGPSEIVYSNDPFVNGKNCDGPTHHINGPSDSALFGGLSHEHNESVTDPEPNNAWTDFGGSQETTGYENGDKCRTFVAESEFGTPLGKTGPENLTYNQEINGHRYWYQQEWSNKGHTCLQRLKFEPSEAPAANFTIGSVSGNTVEFNATGSTSGARYTWQFNDEPGEPKSSEIFASTFIHTFPFAGIFPVALTVFKADGTSRGFAELVTPSREPQTITFTSTAPGSATVGGAAYNVTAEASSKLPVTITRDASSSWACTVSGSTVSLIFAGTCTIDANQSGNGLHSPAPQAQQSFAVAAASVSVAAALVSPPAPPIVVLPVAIIPPAPNSAFTAGAAVFNQKTGVLTFTESVTDPGTFSWLLTFQNGKFGVFAASTSKCKKGYVRLNGRCRPSKIVYAKGSRTFMSGGVVTFTIKPTRSALTALKNALKRKKGLPVTITLTFQSARGGSPVSQTRTLTVKLKKK
jgi:PKD domain